MDLQALNTWLATIDGYIGGSAWFVYLLLGTGLFFTLYLGFPQIRYFRHAWKIVGGRYDEQCQGIPRTFKVWPRRSVERLVLAILPV